MNPSLFKLIILLTLPQEDVAPLQEYAALHNMDVEHLLELYIAERLDIDPTYIYAEIGDEDARTD
jgi:hypothetical protein